MVLFAVRWQEKKQCTQNLNKLFAWHVGCLVGWRVATGARLVAITFLVGMAATALHVIFVDHMGRGWILRRREVENEAWCQASYSHTAWMNFIHTGREMRVNTPSRQSWKWRPVIAMVLRSKNLFCRIKYCEWKLTRKTICDTSDHMERHIISQKCNFEKS